MNILCFPASYHYSLSYSPHQLVPDWGWADLDVKECWNGILPKSINLGSPARVCPEWPQAPGWRENGKLWLKNVLTDPLPEWL